MLMVSSEISLTSTGAGGAAVSLPVVPDVPGDVGTAAAHTNLTAASGPHTGWRTVSRQGRAGLGGFLNDRGPVNNPAVHGGVAG